MTGPIIKIETDPSLRRASQAAQELSPKTRENIRQARKDWKARTKRPLTDRSAAGHIARFMMEPFAGERGKQWLGEDVRKVKAIPKNVYLLISSRDRMVYIVTCDREGNPRGTPMDVPLIRYEAVKKERSIFPTHVGPVVMDDLWSGTIVSLPLAKWRRFQRHLLHHITTRRRSHGFVPEPVIVAKVATPDKVA